MIKDAIENYLKNEKQVQRILNKNIEPPIIRKGDSGWLGRAAEDLMDLPESNSREPDIIEDDFAADLKTKNISSSAEITLVSGLPVDTSIMDIKKTLGYSKTDKIGLYDRVPYLLKVDGTARSVTTNGFYLLSDCELQFPFNTLYLMRNGKPVGSWTFDEYMALMKKIENVILFNIAVIEKYKIINIHDIQMLVGLQPDRFFHGLLSGYLTFNFRLSKSSGKDHSSAFRYNQHQFYKLYDITSMILPEMYDCSTDVIIPVISDEMKKRRELNENELKKKN